MRDSWKANPKFEAVQIDDVATDDFTDALKGMGCQIIPIRIHGLIPFASDR